MAALAVGIFALYQASQRVPEFYRQALEVDPVRQREASDRMLQEAAALASDLEKEGPWRVVISAEEINGWLAVDLVQNHPDTLPPQLSDPRVAIEPDHLTLACRFRRGRFSGVVSLTIDVYLAEPNVIALRICKARAGVLPVPLKKVLDTISRAVRGTEYKLQWRQADGDPVALISMPPPRDQRDKLIVIDSLKLGDGKVYLAGSTK